MTNVYVSSLTATWGSASGATGYEMDASTTGTFTGTLISSITNSVSVTTLTFTSGALFANTTYFVRVGSLGGGTTAYANTTPISTSTLASPITNLLVYAVNGTSITVNWTALPATPSSSTAEGYELDASTSSNFIPLQASSVTTSVALSTLTLNNLTPLTTYYLRAGAINWNNVANYVAVGPVTTPCTAWGNGYCYREAITIDHTKVPNTDQANFPFLFRGTYAFLATQANGGVVTSTSGYDIIFSTDPAGASRLPHEIETYSSTTGNVNMWTQIPTVSHSVNTVIYLFYGNPSITTSQQNTSGVWDSNYLGVWHLPNGTTLTANDSTSNGSNGTLHGTTTATAGQVDGAAAFDGSTSYIGVGGAATISSSRTVSGWINPNVNSGNGNPILVGGTSGSADFFGIAGTAGSCTVGQYNLYIDHWGTACYSSGVAVSTGVWNYVVLVFNPFGTSSVYINGVRTTFTFNEFNYGVNTYTLGGNTAGGSSTKSNFNGILDEVRISNIARSSDWISTEYCNQSTSCAFYSTGPVNGVNSAAITAVSTFTLTASWTGVSVATGYEVDASTASDFSGPLFSSVTTNTAVVSLVDGYANPLSPNTTYYVRVGELADATTYYANTVPVSTSTLANPVTGTQISAFSVPSVTVNWVALPASPSSSTAEGYELDASTDPAFGSIVASSVTTNVNLSTLTVSGLTGATTYYFRVGSLNWDNVANDVSVPGSVLFPQWPNGYYFRQAITIDHTKVGTVNNTDQTNFPFLFRGTYSYLATQANGGVVTSTSGYDIIFSTDPAGGSRLPHEIETYSSTTGNVNMWTQIPTVSHSVNTVIYLFYGNSSITTSQQNTTGVWDSNFKAVWHLANGSSLSTNDSTSSIPTMQPITM